MIHFNIHVFICTALIYWQLRKYVIRFLKHYRILLMDVLETRGLKKLGYESNSKQVRYMYKQ